MKEYKLLLESFGYRLEDFEKVSLRTYADRMNDGRYVGGEDYIDYLVPKQIANDVVNVYWSFDHGKIEFTNKDDVVLLDTHGWAYADLGIPSAFCINDYVRDTISKGPVMTTSKLLKRLAHDIIETMDELQVLNFQLVNNHKDLPMEHVHMLTIKCKTEEYKLSLLIEDFIEENLELDNPSIELPSLYDTCRTVLETTTIPNGTRNALLANDLVNFLSDNGLAADTRIYFNGFCYTRDSGNHSYEMLRRVKASQYVEYADDEGVTVTFEGPLYNLLNHGQSDELYREFSQIFEKHGAYFELGHAWSLVAAW